MTDKEWIEEFARAIGLPVPGEQRFEAILNLAAIAAHASERTAAPAACWLAGQSDRPLDELTEAAEGIAPSA